MEPDPARGPPGRWLTGPFTVLSAAALVAMVVTVAANVFCRAVLGFDLEVSEELAGYLLVAFTFLSLCVCVVRGAFHQVELLTARLPPRGHLLLNTAFTVLSLAITAALDWELVVFFRTSLRTGSVAPTLLATPLWIPQLVMPIGLGFLCAGLLVVLTGQCRRLARQSWHDGRDG